MKNFLHYNFLTSGHQFDAGEKELELNYIFFNAILLINIFVVSTGSVVRIVQGQYLHALFDLVFSAALFTIILLARKDKRYYLLLSYAVLIISFMLAAAIYYLNPDSVIGTSWFLVILMASYYFLDKRERTFTFVASVFIIALVGYMTGRIAADILLGILPLASAYFFLWFADNKHHILRANIEAEKEHFAHHATHDSLTGVFNRYYFFKTLDTAIATASRDNERFALVFIDINEFKQINDRYGHLAGDHILRHMARRIKEELDSRSILARFGGDEFVVLSFKNTRSDAMRIPLENLEKAVSRPFRYEGKNIHLSLSIGIAYYPDDGVSAKALLKHADQTMYRTKNNRNEEA